jgi:hypothetical protein
VYSPRVEPKRTLELEGIERGGSAQDVVSGAQFREGPHARPAVEDGDGLGLNLDAECEIKTRDEEQLVATVLDLVPMLS